MMIIILRRGRIKVGHYFEPLLDEELTSDWLLRNCPLKRSMYKYFLVSVSSIGHKDFNKHLLQRLKFSNDLKATL